jgi:Domain of unknown function (DUF1905)/Bacteriocin-protection, YdeI or OmpD-Associated
VPVKFDGEHEPGTGGGAFVRMPADAVRQLDRGLRLRVRSTLNGVSVRSSTMPAGDGATCLGVHKATRKAAGLAFGDRVSMELEPDDEPHQIEMPADLAEASAAASAFERLSPTRRREIAELIAGARRPETRERRLAAGLEQLREDPSSS